MHARTITQVEDICENRFTRNFAPQRYEKEKPGLRFAWVRVMLFRAVRQMYLHREAKVSKRLETIQARKPAAGSTE
jgi:hypothetical protein